ncbi:MAG: outer membrane beta-barrel protein, partial [Loktanella sp.]|nr:outer membrane beta-barrel protein [Loktanella sp.]
VIAGGLAAPVETLAPTPITPSSAAVQRGSDWGGFYIGGQLGYGRVTAPFLNGFIDADDAEDFVVYNGDFTGGTYGIHAGYMHDLGAIVLGGEIAYDLTTMKVTYQDGLDGVVLDGKSEVESILRLTARVGYDAGAFLPYITGGVVRADISRDIAGASATQRIDGDVYGAGIVYRLRDSILIGGEVLQHKFYETDQGPISGLGIRATTAAARVSFRF